MREIEEAKMTRLSNDPGAFVDEMIEGFVAASGRRVRGVTGGVVRATISAQPTVALVVGGGSGHYPAFAGLVGPGLAHGAAMGDVFASPSTARIRSVARASERGCGVLLSYGNYAGDVINFTEAQEQLRAEGIDVRTVLVTDDIASAPPHERDRRRGIAGDLAVFKIAGAAAEAGKDLDEVERLARHANERTRSLGVALSGCTLPGAEAPLFTVPDGRMAIGLGIHGEPGIEETDVPSADGLAELLVSRLLDEVPDGVEVYDARVAPLLNGLGAITQEELFVVYRAIARLLRERGIGIVEPEVGELCTSFDMAGCSLTLLWLDEELEDLWCAPADAAGYRKGVLPPVETIPAVEHAARAEEERLLDAVPGASDESRSAAAGLVTIFRAISEAIADAEEELGRMDAVAGDGDHGIGMRRGSAAARLAAEAANGAGCGAGTLLVRAADAWGDRAGGTSGALWAAMLRELGGAIGDEVAPDVETVAAGVNAARDAVIALGGAEVGDKTMVDALAPFAEELQRGISSGASLPDAWRSAVVVAGAAAERTADFAAVRGRARTHGDRSLGTPDPGAVSFALVCSAVGGVLMGTPCFLASSEERP